MQAWMGGAMLIEATVLSFLLALGFSWMVLSGLFRLLRSATRLQVVPIR
jgi:type III secretory pathway component EscR